MKKSSITFNCAISMPIPIMYSVLQSATSLIAMLSIVLLIIFIVRIVVRAIYKKQAMDGLNRSLAVIIAAFFIWAVSAYNYIFFMGKYSYILGYSVLSLVLIFIIWMIYYFYKLEDKKLRNIISIILILFFLFTIFKYFQNTYFEKDKPQTWGITDSMPTFGGGCGSSSWW